MQITSKLITKIVNKFPRNIRNDLCKYIFIVGFDKTIKKGFISQSSLDVESLKSYTTQAKIKSRGRIYSYGQDSVDQGIKKEIANLKDEITKLSNHITKASQNKEGTHQQQQSNKENENRKRSSSYDYKKLQKKPPFANYPKQQKQIVEITPKVTETCPYKGQQSIRFTISKHHLDDTEIKQVMQDQYLMFQSAKKKKQQAGSQPHKNKSMYDQRQQQSMIMESSNENNSLQQSIPYSDYQQSDSTDQRMYHTQQDIEDQDRIPIKQQQQEVQLERLKQQKQYLQQQNQYPQQQQLSQQSQKSLISKQSLEQQQQQQQQQQYVRDRSKKSLDTVMEENQSKEQQSLLTSQHSQVQKFSNHSNKSQQQEKLKLKQKQKIYNQQINNHACQSESNLSYNQHKPPSKIKNLIDQDKKFYKNQKTQKQEQDENALNTANFTYKATSSSLMSQPLSQQKLIQSKQNHNRMVNNEDDQYTKIVGGNLYKSTVTSVLNEDSNQSINHFQNDHPQNNNQSSQFSYQNDSRKPTPSAQSASISNQQTKRSKGEMSFVNSPQIFGDQRKLRYENSEFSGNKQENIQYNGNQIDNSKDSSQEIINRKYRNMSQPEEYSKSRGEDDYNRSSVSSNFSMFNPNEELKNFFQNDFLERKKQQSEMRNQVSMNQQSSMSSSNNSEYQPSQKKSQMMSHNSQIHETSGFGQLNFKKRQLDYSQDNIEKSNVFNNNRLSVTRILNNSQQI